MRADDVPQEWVEAGARALYVGRGNDPRTWSKRNHLYRADYLHMAQDVLAAVIPRVKVAALREWAQQVRETYPEDVFVPHDKESLREVRDLLAAGGRTIDALSAHLMRCAAHWAEYDARRIEREDVQL